MPSSSRRRSRRRGSSPREPSSRRFEPSSRRRRSEEPAEPSEKKPAVPAGPTIWERVRGLKVIQLKKRTHSVCLVAGVVSLGVLMLSSVVVCCCYCRSEGPEVANYRVFHELLLQELVMKETPAKTRVYTEDGFKPLPGVNKEDETWKAYISRRFTKDKCTDILKNASGKGVGGAGGVNVSPLLMEACGRVEKNATRSTVCCQLLLPVSIILVLASFIGFLVTFMFQGMFLDATPEGQETAVEGGESATTTDTGGGQPAVDNGAEQSGATDAATPQSNSETTLGQTTTPNYNTVDDPSLAGPSAATSGAAAVSSSSSSRISRSSPVSKKKKRRSDEVNEDAPAMEFDEENDPAVGSARATGPVGSVNPKSGRSPLTSAISSGPRADENSRGNGIRNSAGVPDSPSTLNAKKSRALQTLEEDTRALAALSGFAPGSNVSNVSLSPLISLNSSPVVMHSINDDSLDSLQPQFLDDGV